MRIDPVSLQLFIAVVETGSIAAASEREHLAAAAISRRMAELEDLLGTPLLLRHAHGVEATPAGLAMRDLARQALHVLDDVPVQLQGFASGVSGQVRVFANTSSITQFLPADLASFTAEHPQVRIQLEESNSPATIRAVAENAADLGVYTAFAHGDHVQSLAYRRDCLCLVVPRQHRLAQTPAVKFLTLEAASAAAAAVPTPAAAAAAPAAAAPAPAPVAAPAGPAGSCSGPVDVECDVLVLGAGPGGYSAAFRTADPTLGESIGMAAEVAHGSCTDLPLQKK